MENHGLKDYNIVMKDGAVRDVIRYYTRESGVRNLEREFANVFRKVAKDIVMSNELEQFKKTDTATATSVKTKGSKVTAKKKTAKTKEKVYTITSEKVVELIGPHKNRHGEIEKQNEVGLTNGMAWTEVGGDLLAVEVSAVPGKGKFTVTGQLGDVMKESCIAAMSYTRSRGPLFGLDKEFYENIDIHIHFPDGATPKDGPSAGIALTTSIVSAMLKIPVKRTVAMTGEISLRGKVLPIGGLKEKILAAHRGGIKTIICPKENEKDLKDIPKEVLKELKVILVDHVDQVLINALEVKGPKDIFKNAQESRQGVKANYTGQQVHTH
jgi:ATP-dependent Lon protease